MAPTIIVVSWASLLPSSDLIEFYFLWPPLIERYALLKPVVLCLVNSSRQSWIWTPNLNICDHLWYCSSKPRMDIFGSTRFVVKVGFLVSRRNCPIGQHFLTGWLLAHYSNLLLNLAFVTRSVNKLAIFVCLLQNTPVQKTWSLQDHIED